MVQLIVIVSALALHLRDLLGIDPSYAIRLPPWATGATLTGTLLALWGIVHATCVGLGRAMDAGSRFAPHRAERVMGTCRVLAVWAHLWACVGMDWMGAVREGIGSLIPGTGSAAARGDLIAVDELVALLPILGYLAGAWWSFYPIERRLREAALFRQIEAGRAVYAPPSRGQYVWSAVRHQVLMVLIPLMLITGWQEVVVAYGEGWGIPKRHREWALPLVALAGAVVIFATTPALLKAVWDTVPIGEGEFRRMLDALCARYGVRVRTPLLWRTHGGMVNGAVLGLAWPLRYMLFTDALLDHLSPPQVEAVAAHEVGHVVHRHIPWLGVSIVASLLMAEWAVVGIAWAAREAGWLASGGMVLVPLVVGGWVFGMVSRRFEWQADAFAAKHMSEGSTTLPAPAGLPTAGALGPVITPEAVECVASTLMEVASVNGVDPRRFGFRHGSILERIARLRSLVRAPGGRLPIDRQVLVIKLVSGVLFVLSVGALVASVALGWGGVPG